ncbi:flagellar hook-length control protein FliK, partial [Agromyces soli]
PAAATAATGDGVAALAASAPSSPAAATAPTAPAAAPAGASAATAPALAEQLGGHLVSLARRGPGEHLVSVRVAPEEFGPVTVRAVVGADGHVRVELHAPSDAGREALRQALGDLRRDGAAAGLAGSLDLAPQDRDGGRQAGDDARTAAPAEEPRAAAPARALAPTPVPTGPMPLGTGLDVIA